VRIEEAREGMFRRAAFGLEDEIVPLVRGGSMVGVRMLDAGYCARSNALTV
jgi:hypothetical protein